MSVDFSTVGLSVGHATDERGATGLTVIRGTTGHHIGGVCVLGRATGTREIETLAPSHHAARVDAILLTGGSAYGLDAAAGVMRWMEERKRGFDVAAGVVPIVPAAVIYDLTPLGAFTARPGAEMAYAACESAVSTGVAEGSVGVGTGATVGKVAGPAHLMKGGFGVASVTAGGTVVCAAAVVNAVGDVRDAEGRIIAGARGEDGAFLDSAALLTRAATPPRFGKLGQHNTTLCVVATNVRLERGELTQLARSAAAALFRRITPAGTSLDGDVIFALCPPTGVAGNLMAVEPIATLALEDAIERGVRAARGRDGVRGLADARA